MTRTTEPLREEHRELLPHIEHLRTVADSIGEAPHDALRSAIEHCNAFLSQHLIPHAQAEEQVLYPVVAQLMGAPEATRTMSREHAEIRRLTDELSQLIATMGDTDAGAHQHRDLQRVLYGLYALVTAHFAEEEDVYLPILDERLSERDAHRMFASMEEVARKAKESAPAA